MNFQHNTWNIFNHKVGFFTYAEKNVLTTLSGSFNVTITEDEMVIPDSPAKHRASPACCGMLGQSGGIIAAIPPD
jgi:hypothetical protein